MAYDYKQSDMKILELEQIISTTIDETILREKKEELIKWQKTWDTRYLAYYTDMLEFWRILYNPNNSDWNGNKHWNPEYVTYTDGMIHIINHAAIPFWIDFCDDSYLEKYTPEKIGRRTKVINDPEIKAIFFEETPNILFVDPRETTLQTDTSLSYVRLNLVGGMANYFNISTQGKSAKEVLDNLLYTHTYYNENINLTCIPIYYLEPNTRISVYDETSGINGEYIIKSYSIQLVYNGSMSITATRAEEFIL